MSHQQIAPFKIMGISVRTTNENGQAMKDIPALWNRFMSEGIADKIPNKIEQSIYCIYTDYEKDHTKPYTTIIGCRVDHLDNIPADIIGETFSGGNYVQFTAKGNLLHGAVYNEWIKIWNADLARTYTADFEVYDEKAQNPGDAAVDIFIAISQP